MAIDISIEAGVAVLKINRPEKRNALSNELRKAFADGIERIARDHEIRALLITGEGETFCAGADLEQFGPEGPVAARARMQQGGHRLIRALHELEKPVVAAVRGHVIGLGWAIALACDIVIAARSARFSLPFVKRGLLADTAAIYFLTRQLGMYRAKELVYSARVVTADDAVALGLANSAVEDADLISTAERSVRAFADGPTFSLGLMRKLFNFSHAPSLSEYLEMESLMSPQLRHTDDFQEGMRAFAEKRAPKFSGR
jgi:2-(1,2-epoxy-1,2-dihydrophenyl)acetyl-CoA isomerase